MLGHDGDEEDTFYGVLMVLVVRLTTKRLPLGALTKLGWPCRHQREAVLLKVVLERYIL